MKELYFADQSRYDNGMEYERCGRSMWVSLTGRWNP